MLSVLETTVTHTHTNITTRKLKITVKKIIQILNGSEQIFFIFVYSSSQKSFLLALPDKKLSRKCRTSMVRVNINEKGPDRRHFTDLCQNSGPQIEIKKNRRVLFFYSHGCYTKNRVSI